MYVVNNCLHEYSLANAYRDSAQTSPLAVKSMLEDEARTLSFVISRYARFDLTCPIPPKNIPKKSERKKIALHGVKMQFSKNPLVL
jgi:hypothetical protein